MNRQGTGKVSALTAPREPAQQEAGWPVGTRAASAPATPVRLPAAFLRGPTAHTGTTLMARLVVAAHGGLSGDHT